MEKLHPGARWLFRVRAYVTLLFLVIFFSSWAFGFVAVNALTTGSISFLIIPLLSGLVLFIILSEVYSRLAYKFWKYELSSRELKIEKGIIFKVYKSIPYERVQNIDIHRGILARIIGFSTLNIQTAGYSYSGRRGGAFSEGYIPAVSVKDAEKIRTFLIKKIGKKQGL